MSSHEYSTQYSPAMPVCQVYLGPGGGEATLGPLEAILHTGADLTVIPGKYLRQMGARRVDRGRARSLWGDTRSVDVYSIALNVDDLRVTAMRVLSDDRGDEIVLGRLVLNRLRILLDGPAGMVEIS